MSARLVVVILATLAAVTPIGCQRAGTATPTRSTPVATAPAPIVTAPVAPNATERTDYRTLSRTEIESLIRVKMGVEMGPLVPGGLNHYNAQISAPDGTQLPLEVTVEAERIICDTKTPAGSTRQVITPRGLEPGRPDIK